MPSGGFAPKTSYAGVVITYLKYYNVCRLKNSMIITIDGPAGSGKSTVAARLAQRLGIAYLDTGAMYRAATLAALQENVSLDDSDALVDLLNRCRLEPALTADAGRVLLNGKDVSDAIRSPEVTNQAHKLASQPAVRRLLVQEQRQIAQQVISLVTEGRDQGTVVFPNADFKFYLDADPICRARRRCRQLQQIGHEISYEQILAEQQQRDLRDAQRLDGPLKVPEDALIIDTTEMTIDQVVETLYQRIKRIQGGD